MSHIILKNINKSFGEKTVFENLNCSFEKGTCTCIMGESGKGKTTLFNLLLGLQKPDSGEIIGVPKKISAVFQEDRLSEPYSAVQNVFAVTGKSVPKEKIIALLTELGLSGSENIPVSQLSGGMRRRVAIARALLAESELIIFDEPFKGLDESTKQKNVNTILSYTKNKTLLLSTHDKSDPVLFGSAIFSVPR